MRIPLSPGSATPWIKSPLSTPGVQPLEFFLSFLSLVCFPGSNLECTSPTQPCRLCIYFCFISISFFPEFSACFLFSLYGVYTTTILDICGALFLVTHKSMSPSLFIPCMQFQQPIYHSECSPREKMLRLGVFRYL